MTDIGNRYQLKMIVLLSFSRFNVVGCNPSPINYQVTTVSPSPVSGQTPTAVPPNVSGQTPTTVNPSFTTPSGEISAVPFIIVNGIYETKSLNKVLQTSNHLQNKKTLMTERHL